MGSRKTQEAHMAAYQYCTPQWLEESGKSYQSNPEFREKLKKLSVKMCYRVKAEPAWGIDKDIIFGMFVDKGELTKIAFFSEEEALKEAEYIISATPQEWKKILRKQSKFITDFMLGKIKLEHGSKVGVLGVAPHANTVVDLLTQVDLQFPDEMSAEELAAYRANFEEFRAELGV
jgi:putative sterol carrier protein